MTRSQRDDMLEALVAASSEVQRAYRVACEKGHALVAAELLKAAWTIAGAISLAAGGSSAERVS